MYSIESKEVQDLEGKGKRFIEHEKRETASEGAWQLQWQRDSFGHIIEDCTGKGSDDLVMGRGYVGAFLRATGKLGRGYMEGDGQGVFPIQPISSQILF